LQNIIKGGKMKKLILSITILLVGASVGFSEEFNIKIKKDLDVPLPKIGSLKTGEKAIFGDNSMQDYYQVSDELKKLADSTVAFVNKKSLVYDANTKTYKVAKEIKVSANYVDDNEDFVNQDVLSFCSGAYVGNSYIISAGHCVDTSNKNAFDYYDNVYIVFGWRYDSDNTPVLSFNEDQVYTIKEVKIRKLSSSISSFDALLNNYEDYSLSVLDRDPVNKKALVVDKNPDINTGKKVFTIGYPLGMAVKIDRPEDAEIKLVGKNTFQTNIDAFGGNSGGPVFDSNTKKIIGILVTGFDGEFDYELKEDIIFNVKLSASIDGMAVDLKTRTLYTDFQSLLYVKREIVSKYKGKFLNNGNGYIAIIKAGTKINNRDITFKVVERMFGAKVLNKGKLVRYPQDDYGTGIMRIPSSIINEIYR
jgi:V8-like Glu-specific endopeptidase